jgi:predicted transcriptional regulator
MEDAVALADLRESRQVTQVQLAERLGVSQSNVSRLEARSDVYPSTLHSYVEALGDTSRSRPCSARSACRCRWGLTSNP